MTAQLTTANADQVDPNSNDTREVNPQGVARQARSKRRHRSSNSVNSLLAHGEPMLWLTGGGLILCVLMIVGLLALVLYQGSTTFWPSPVVQIKTHDDPKVFTAGILGGCNQAST